MKRKSELLNEARALLTGEPPSREPKIWVVTMFDGVENCDQPGWPDEVISTDTIIRVVSKDVPERQPEPERTEPAPAPVPDQEPEPEPETQQAASTQSTPRPISRAALIMKELEARRRRVTL